MKVFVYFNLHSKLWSLRAMEGKEKGHVIGHARQLVLDDATFKVSEAGRQRVLREKRKNVHAGVAGELSLKPDFSAAAQGVRVSYNPYKGPDFVEAETGQPIHRARKVVFGSDRRVFAVK